MPKFKVTIGYITCMYFNLPAENKEAVIKMVNEGRLDDKSPHYIKTKSAEVDTEIEEVK